MSVSEWLHGMGLAQYESHFMNTGTTLLIVVFFINLFFYLFHCLSLASVSVQNDGTYNMNDIYTSSYIICSPWDITIRVSLNQTTF